jgi:hypothetical protein
MFIGTDKISEIVNRSGSGDSSFSEISDRDTCMVEYILIIRNKKYLFGNHTHERVRQVISGITGVCVLMQFLFQCLRIGSSHFLPCYN